MPGESLKLLPESIFANDLEPIVNLIEVEICAETLSIPPTKN